VLNRTRLDQSINAHDEQRQLSTRPRPFGVLSRSSRFTGISIQYPTSCTKRIYSGVQILERVLPCSVAFSMS
jgi:hypothetical protein